MHICEQVIKSANFLKSKGFTQEQLTSIHHFSLKGNVQNYGALLKYFGDNKNLQIKNTDFANRIIFVANEYNNNGSFTQLINQALVKWPLT